MRWRLAEQHEQAAAAYRAQLETVGDGRRREKLNRKIVEHEEAAAFNRAEARRAERGAEGLCATPGASPQPLEPDGEGSDTLQEPPRGWTR